MPIKRSPRSLFRALSSILRGRARKPQRYQQLLDIIAEVRPIRLMEIGTWNGLNALRMIEKAQSLRPATPIEYHGFDLFEHMTPELLAAEVSKDPPPQRKVASRLEASGAKVHLYAGLTSETLPSACETLPLMDFIFIDGGHRIETVRNDWNYSQRLMGENGVVVFDDYYTGDWASAGGIGCQDLIDGEVRHSQFHVTILPVQDAFPKPDGTVQRINLVKVERRRSDSASR